MRNGGLAAAEDGRLGTVTIECLVRKINRPRTNAQFCKMILAPR
ncbi:hypothetical protein GL4_2186 [Methyloceanibacter caenitepidi]|uniref:Uncharacterized protein n=1 Tax=Methyloceanibacter caenitepidi TaxID=1384459 RepID=A0A0A8K6J6_9HYPH|nr:hypothetical protein GL4_2186 [Methyloceanibacter caenitepidi]